MTLTSIYFEVLRSDCAPDRFVSGATAMVRGTAAYVSDDNTIQKAAATYYPIGCVTNAASEGEYTSVIRRGKVRVWNNAAVFDGTWSSLAFGSPIYISDGGEFTHTSDSSKHAFAGIVVGGNSTTAALSDYVDVELDINMNVALSA